MGGGWLPHGACVSLGRAPAPAGPGVAQSPLVASLWVVQPLQVPAPGQRGVQGVRWARGAQCVVVGMVWGCKAVEPPEGLVLG